MADDLADDEWWLTEKDGNTDKTADSKLFLCTFYECYNLSVNYGAIMCTRQPKKAQIRGSFISGGNTCEQHNKQRQIEGTKSNPGC